MTPQRSARSPGRAPISGSGPSVRSLRAILAAAWMALLGGPVGSAETGAPPASPPSTWPGETWERVRPAAAGLESGPLEAARDHALTGEGSGFITRHGRLVMSWGDTHRRYDLKSTSKSIGVTALGLALADGKIRLDDPASRHHPTFGTPPASNRETGWLERVTIRHLATQTAGFEKPGGYTRILFEPGTRWLYSDGGPNWLAECITLAYRRDIEDLMYERVLTPIGVSRRDLRWRKNAYRPERIDGVPRREFGSGVHASVDAMARIGLLYLRRGAWRGRQLLPASFVDSVRRTPADVAGLPEHRDGYGKELGDASAHYGLLWWNNSDGALKLVPRSTYWSWGLHDSLIVVFPDLGIVATRAGKSWRRRSGAGHYDVLRPFLEPIVRAASGP